MASQLTGMLLQLEPNSLLLVCSSDDSLKERLREAKDLLSAAMVATEMPAAQQSSGAAVSSGAAEASNNASQQSGGGGGTSAPPYSALAR